MIDPKDWSEAIDAGADVMKAVSDDTGFYVTDTGDVLPGNIPPRPGVQARKCQYVPIQTSGQFIANFKPPDYFMDGILQRRFIYSFTGQTGSGKTAIALLIAALAAQGLPLDGHDIAKVRVLYLAGENPDDIRMRWIAMADQMGFDPKTINVHFMEGSFDIAEIMEHVTGEVKKLGGIDFVIVDTSAAYFVGDCENDNVDAGTHARMLRKLTTLPGGPCVLAACHPVKNATNSNLIPRGGGAFLAEVDGNLVCKESDSIIEIHWQGKFRGPDFEPIGFELATITSENLKDSKGRLIPTVMAKPLTELRRVSIEKEAFSDENAVLVTLLHEPRITLRAICDRNKWLSKKGNFSVSRAQRIVAKLKRSQLVISERSGIELTPKGEKEAKALKEGS